MKVAILGGSFNPPHFGHYFIANLALKKFSFDQIWIIPTLQNPLKENSDLSFENRLKLCRDFFNKNPKFKVKNYKNHSISTFELITKLKAEHKNINFSFIIGEDSLENLHKWQRFSDLIKITEFLVFSRSQKNFWPRKTKIFNIYQNYRHNLSEKKSTKFQPKITIVKSKNIAISSSEIRLK